jgi:flagellar basal-body rod modification protein FlgD
MASINGFSSLGSPIGLEQSPTNSASQSNLASQSVEKNEFLKLLVAQLQNQDPLNPLNSDQFVTQLAQFNSLEQLMSINQAVTKLADARNAGASGAGATPGN